MRILIAIPAYNESATVAEVAAAARTYGPVLVIDDGSSDDTAARATAAGAEVIQHPKRRGKSAALATAFDAARARGADLVVTLDADGQHDPADVPALLAAAHGHPRAIVIGSRPEATLPAARALAISLAGFWMNWITGVPIADTQSGFRVYPLALLDAVPLRGRRFVSETAILVDAVRRGWRVTEIPIRSVPRAARPSRFHPLADGASIAAYLVAGSLARWGTELRAAAHDVRLVVSGERRKARHARMLAYASPHAGTPMWGPAIGMAAMTELRGRLDAWARDPRWRRGRYVAIATLAAPALLLVLGLAALVRGAMPRAVDRAIRWIYDQRALPALIGVADPQRAEESETWVTVTR